MTDFDTRLRRDLRAAADSAPTFTGLREPTRRFPHTRPHVLLAAAAATVAVTATGLWWAGGIGPAAPPEASCPATLLFDGGTYLQHGDQVRTPRPGSRLGTGTLGCSDGDQVTVRELPGADPDRVVLTDTGVWIIEDAAPLPAAAAILAQPVACTREQPFTVSGDWVSMTGPMPDDDNTLVPPYVAVIAADQGDHLPLDQWSSITIDVRVTPDTTGGTDPDLARTALRGPRRVQATVRCTDGQFVAVTLTAAR